MRSAAAGLALIGLSAVGFALYVNEFSETGRAFGGLVLLAAWAAFAAGVGRRRGARRRRGCCRRRACLTGRAT